MGNCIEVEAAAVVVEHPDGRVVRAYRSLRASDVMASNPGHYVALIATSNPTGDNKRSSAAQTKQLELLRPDDTLHIGLAYRLVSFEEVLKEFESKKHLRLSRRPTARDNSKDIIQPKCGTWRKERRYRMGGMSRTKWREGMLCLRCCSRHEPSDESDPMKSPIAVVEKQQEEELHWAERSDGWKSSAGLFRYRQWRPTLQSIAEAET